MDLTFQNLTSLNVKDLQTINSIVLPVVYSATTYNLILKSSDYSFLGMM
jgi:hypothetical protein